MAEKVQRAVAVVGVGAVLPDAPNATAYWENLKAGKYSISEVPGDRWDPSLYFDPDPKAPDKTYSTIGGWVREADFSPLEWRMPIPPKVSDAMDPTQKWSIAASREALLDYGYPDRPLDTDRTAVVLGNAMAGDKHYLTALRAYYPEYATELSNAPSFAALDTGLRETILEELLGGVRRRFPDITEDTMPGELANIIAGRVANLFDFHGPNFVVDAACASALAAIDAAIEGLEHGDYDAVLTGGIDANMGVPTFIKFCKIGALSATGTRPYHEGADGFVMGEGAAVFLLKRLADAERDGDRIYAVIRGMGGSSDGKGKGITAPNPVGQEFAIARAWKNANLVPNSATYIEGHGTSTRVGDVVEAESLSRVFADLGLKPGTIPLGSVKSNIGHLKSAAGAAGMLKAILSLDRKQLAPSLGETMPNPNIDFSRSPFYINKELQEWKTEPGQVRNAAVSAFGFGGTNFHVVLEEYVPGRLRVDDGSPARAAATTTSPAEVSGADLKTPLRGALVVGDETIDTVRARLEAVLESARKGDAPDPQPPLESDLRAPVRIAIDYGDAAELVDKIERAFGAIDADRPVKWKALRNRGVFLGTGSPGQVAFLYTGQGSQYVNMLDSLRTTEPVVADVFDEADRIMQPVLGKPLTDYIFAPDDDPEAMEEADLQLRQTEITQPAVLAVDAALTALLAAYGFHPDMVMGHSLGEYGALVAAGAMPFEDALEAVAGRGREMASVEVEDNGAMAAVAAPLEDVARITEEVDDYVVVANYNSLKQAVIGGSTAGVDEATKRLKDAGAQVIPLPVSHAFHTEIVAPAAAPLKDLLERMRLESPAIPIVANIDGSFYPMGPNVVPKMIDILGKQIASPVQFVDGLRTLHDAGCRVFVEVGPKKALQGLADNVLGEDADVVTLSTNHPKQGDRTSFNYAICGLYAAGLGVGRRSDGLMPTAPREAPKTTREHRPPAPSPQPPKAPEPVAAASTDPDGGMYMELGHLFADFLEKGAAIYGGKGGEPASADPYTAPDLMHAERPVVVTGAGLGLPGHEQVFGDDKVPSLLAGNQFITSIPAEQRQKITDKKITRLVKSEAGGGHFETISDQADVIKLAGRGGTVDLVGQFGFPEERIDALDRTSELAIGAGLDALRDAGIPLVMQYKDTTTGTKLPDRWMLPESYQATTGVIFASAFPGNNAWMEEAERYYGVQAREQRLADLRDLQSRIAAVGSVPQLAEDLGRQIQDLESELAANVYTFDRKFLYRAVSFGHAQFAEYIGARGPNTQVNGACASTTQAVAIAEDWIRTGRCERVVIISGDDVTSDHMLEWIGAGFLTMGAAATDADVADAALPFDRRRHGLILGMGAAAVVVEHPDSVASRGLSPIAEVLSANTANSAFHGSRLDPDHIMTVMEDVIATAERRWGIDRHQIAPTTVFVSHETYTPARGGSAQAEIDALRHVFGESADRIVIANTKGYTGHAMGAGVEDILAIKSMETGLVPPVPNYREPDPDLGDLNLSRGGAHPVEYALRLGAGFGSQISMTLYRRVPQPSGVRPAPDLLGYETRIADAAQWNSWLAGAAGESDAGVEIYKRTLRVPDGGAPAAAPAPPVQKPVTEPPPAPAPEVEAVAPPATVGIADRVLALVSEQTGYPPDMLDLDLDLEADLGVDTVKQAETFAAIRQEYEIERDDSLALRDYPTLNDVIGFVLAKRPDLAASVASEPPTSLPTESEVPASDGAGSVADRVLALVSEQTGYPPDMLDLDLDLEADLGVDTVKQAETFAAIRQEYEIERDDSLALRDYPTLNDVIGFVLDKRPDLAGVTTPAPDPTPSTASPVTETAQRAAGAGVADRVLALVSEQTGYPPDMLDLDLDLEADLGVDTVKQAETFAAIRQEYEIERDDSLALRDYPTLNDVIGFVLEKRPDLAGESTPAAAAVATPDGADPVAGRVLALVSEQTGYPPDMLDLDLDLEADLGVDTVKQAETFAAIREEYGIERDDSLALRDYPTLNDVIGFVHTKRPDLAGPAATPSPAVEPPATAADSAATEKTPVVSTGGVEDRVLALVSEQTGYPPDMLDLDLDLEADLGVDTVKQAETFAAIREEYGIERDDSLALRDYPTLNDVIGFVHTKRPDLAGTSAQPVPSAAPEATPMPPVASSLLSGDDAAAAEIARRIPAPMLRPDIGHCLPSGVSLDSDSRVVVMLDEGGVGRSLLMRLDKLDVATLTLEGALDADEVRARLDAFSEKGPISGVYWLSALDAEDSVADLDLAGWQEALRRRVKLLYETMRHLYDTVGDSGTFLVAATRLGGLHGYGPDGATAPMGGATVGFTKAFKREKPDAQVKAVDFPVSRKTAALADALIEETLFDPGAVEIGRKDGRRWTVGIVEEDLPEEPAGIDLGPDSVFVVTGAAGSITSAITADFAGASQGTFHLLDLTPEPDRDDLDVAAFSTDREGLKRTIFERLKAAGDKATPAVVERHLADIERRHAALSTIQAIEAAGGTAVYHSVDLRDGDAVGAAMARVREDHDRVDVLLHAGGLEISRLLPDKERGEFDLVFDVKADGWFNLLHGLGDLPIRSTVAFSSVAGRFGNNGQTDYSAANDLLCKYTSHFRSDGEETLGLVIDWTAWGDIGMATRGSIPTVMKAAGIDMLPAAAGIPIVRRELIFRRTGGEMVVGKRLGLLTGEFHETGGLDPDSVTAADSSIMIDSVAGFGIYTGLQATVELDPGQQPFLFDHQIDGTPVLPGVMGVEFFAAAAKAGFPDRQVAGIEDVDFLAPFKFYRGEPRQLSVEVQYTLDGEDVIGTCRLIGVRTLANQDEPQRTVHFMGRVRLSVDPPAGGKADVPEPGDVIVTADDVYRIYFHGPAYQVVAAAWQDGDGVAAAMASDLPENHEPEGHSLVTSPRLTELAFQAAGIWEIGTTGSMALPLHIDRVVYVPKPGAGQISVIVRTADDGGFDASVVDGEGAILVTMTGYRTVRLPAPVDPDAVVPLRTAMTNGG